MGSEVNCRMKIDGKEYKGKALLETDELIFRGERNLRIFFKDMKSVDVGDDELSVVFRGGSASFSLESNAGIWQQKILHPKSVLDKLGVKENSRVSVVGVDNKQFLKELKRRTQSISEDRPQKESDFIFYEANSAKELTEVAALKRFLKQNGAMWIVSLKGKQARIKDTEVMAAGKKAGLVDTKVVGFSETHTALKFVIPAAGRKKKSIIN